MKKALRKHLQAGRLEAGCDEAGRGCLAGPVYAAAVILPPHFEAPALKDSKQLRASQRETLRLQIEAEALSWAVASVDVDEIDRINILNAALKAMHRAVAQLDPSPDFLLIDGNRFQPYPGIAHSCEVKGDGRFLAIAAASVLAKTHRDEYMSHLATAYSPYGWERNMGYPTRAHRQAIAEHGLTPHHRRSFKQLPGQMRLPLKKPS